MNKNVEETILETKEVLRQVIIESNLSPSIAEMIIHEVYLEVRDLAQQNLVRILAERKQKSEEVEDNGEHTNVS